MDTMNETNNNVNIKKVRNKPNLKSIKNHNIYQEIDDKYKELNRQRRQEYLVYKTVFRDNI